MSTIKVECGINNPECSPSRTFEIESFESLDFENHMTMAELEMNAKLLCILSNCFAICKERDVNRKIADITIADNSIFYRIANITKLIRKIDGFNPFYTLLDYTRVVNNFIYETETERAFCAQQYDVILEKTNHLISCIWPILSETFADGLTSIWGNNNNNKTILVPTSDAVKLFNVTKNELYYGVNIKCNGEELILCEQEFENLTLELDEVVNHGNTELFDSAIVGIIAAFMDGNE